MKMKYLSELFEYHNYEYSDIEFIDSDESESGENELIIYNKDEFYEIDELLQYLSISHDLLSENYDYIVLKLNLIENKNKLDSYHDLISYYIENKEYKKLLENDSEYIESLNHVGMNKISDAKFKFYMNHKDFFSYDLNESYTDIYDLFSEIIDESDLYNNKGIILYENLESFYDSYDIESGEFYAIFRNYEIDISDESNIMINKRKGIIKNIDESEYKKLLKYVLLSELTEKAYDPENNEIINELKHEKIYEFIELLNVFSGYMNFEILENTEYNLKYIHNKLLIGFNSFRKYSNKDEFIFIKYNKVNENESISESELMMKSESLINELIDASLYYEYDSYEFHEFMKIMKLLL